MEDRGSVTNGTTVLLDQMELQFCLIIFAVVLAARGVEGEAGGRGEGEEGQGGE